MITINLHDLAECFDLRFDTMTHYLDLQTGEIVPLLSDVSNEPDAPEWQREQQARNEEIERNEGGRFAYIEPIDAHEGFRWMELFVDSVGDPKEGELLARALQGPKPFRRFKDALQETRSEGPRYFAFRQRKLEEHAQEWLESLKVEYRWAEVSA